MKLMSAWGETSSRAGLLFHGGDNQPVP